MTILEAIILGIVQGITEFLPISSSGHLILAEKMLGLSFTSLKTFDIALHLGTLIAILLFFRNDFLALGKEALRGKFDNLCWLALGTMPAVIIGATLGSTIDNAFRNPTAVAITLIVFSFVFLLAEKYPPKKDAELITKNHSRLKNILRMLFIGCMQALALIPGISRSGATISAGLLLGVERARSARTSFLLGAIAIAGASVLGIKDIVSGVTALPPPSLFLIGTISSFVAGYFTIAFLMRFLTSHTLKPFAFYRIIVGIGALYFFSLT